MTEAPLDDDSLPRDNGELVFEAPWQARALAIAVALVDNLGLPWDAFRRRLMDEIATDPQRPYYESWTKALESMVVDLHLTTAGALDAAEPTERAALGYLHANCGHCHSKPSETGASVPVEALLAQEAGGGRNAVLDALRSLVGKPSRFRAAGSDDETQIVMPGHAERSVLTLRMGSRDPRVQMPPLGTAMPDTEALALVARWINEDLNPQKETLP